MFNKKNTIRRRVGDRVQTYFEAEYIEQKYIYVFISATFLGLLISPLLPSSILTGLLTAGAIFIIHESVKMRFAILVDTLSSSYSNLFPQVARDSYIFVGSAVLLDLIIAVPMFSSQAYAWRYTMMVIAYIGMFTLYVRFGKYMINEISVAVDKARNQTDEISKDFDQWLRSLNDHPAVPSKYSTYLGKTTKLIAPSGLVVFDIFLLTICLVYLAIYHPQLMQFNLGIWMSTLLQPVNPSIWLLFSMIVVLINTLMVSIAVLLLVIVISITLLPPITFVSLLIAPEFVWQGIEKAPESIHQWGAVSIIILFIIYFLPPTLQYRSSA
jgi:hypothetical protein